MIVATNARHAHRGVYVYRGSISQTHRTRLVSVQISNQRGNHHDELRLEPKQARMLAYELLRVANEVEPPEVDERSVEEEPRVATIPGNVAAWLAESRVPE